jgi:hypothetical protein
MQQQEYPGGSLESEPLWSAVVNFPRLPQAEMVQGSTSPSVHETVAWMGSSFAQKEFGCHESSRTQTLRNRCILDLRFLSPSSHQQGGARNDTNMHNSRHNRGAREEGKNGKLFF